MEMNKLEENWSEKGARPNVVYVDPPLLPLVVTIDTPCYGISSLEQIHNTQTNNQ